MGGWSDSDPNWKKVGGAKKVPRSCPRCKNSVEFELVSDSAGISLYGLASTLIPMKRYWAIKCPICIYYEPITSQEAKELKSWS